MNDRPHRPYVRKASSAPPPPDSESVSVGVQSMRWTKRCDQPERLRAAAAAVRALLTGETKPEGGAL